MSKSSSTGSGYNDNGHDVTRYTMSEEEEGLGRMKGVEIKKRFERFDSKE